MSGIGLEVTIEGDLARQVGQFVADLRDRQVINKSIGKSAEGITRDWLREIGLSRHDTAERLGATPSGHWAQASEKVLAKADSESATVTTPHPGIGRVAHDVTIHPKGMYLTIPNIAAAYNQRAYRVPGLFFVNFGDHAALGKREGDEVTWWYNLVTEVTQKQDRTLLPSDDAYSKSAVDGARDAVDYLMRRKGLK